MRSFSRLIRMRILSMRRMSRVRGVRRMMHRRSIITSISSMF